MLTAADFPSQRQQAAALRLRIAESLAEREQAAILVVAELLRERRLELRLAA